MKKGEWEDRCNAQLYITSLLGEVNYETFTYKAYFKGVLFKVVQRNNQ